MSYQPTDSTRINNSKLAICITFIVTIIISWKLWLTDRRYPLVPVFDFIPTIPYPFDYILIGTFLLLLILIAFKENSRPLIIALFALFCIEVITDQNRLQPYFYQFIFMLLCLINYRKNDMKSESLVINSMRIIVIGIYFWAGIQKMNSHFIDRFYQFFTYNYPVLPGFEQQDTLRKYSILILPSIEVFIALGLMFKRTRRIAVTMAVMMHIFISVYLSPLGFGWNIIVIPWNISLILMLYFLFWNADFSLIGLWSLRKSLVKGLVTVLFIIMPLFNFFGLWDHYLSGSLYSCKIKYGAIFITDKVKKDLPKWMNEYIKESSEGEYIETTYWTLGELNVTPYPEERVYRKVRDYVCTLTEEPCEASLVMYR